MTNEERQVEALATLKQWFEVCQEGYRQFEAGRTDETQACLVKALELRQRYRSLIATMTLMVLMAIMPESALGISEL
jgi:hypothetical protein